MFEAIKSKVNIWKTLFAAKGIGDSSGEYTQLKTSLIENMVVFQGKFDGCADFVYKEVRICGKRAVFMMIDNMIDKLTLSQAVMEPLAKAVRPADIDDDEALLEWIRDSALSAIDQREVFTVEECLWLMMAGFVILIIDGYAKALAFGLQSFKYRSIGEPSTETVMQGSREGFVEPLRINLTMIRRRIKNNNLKFETYMLGSESKTEVCIAYIKGIAEESLIDEVRRRLMCVGIDTILASGYLQKYLQDNPLSIFATVGSTERPDTLCGKLNEGRIGVLVDGTPVALIFPYLFVENFQNMDDYALGAYYAFFTRLLKFLAFFISVIIPGLYVAVGSFHQELLPSPLLYTLAQSEEGTPFSLFIEAILMQVIYEMLREAGLRSPKPLGSSLNIVGAFLIGQAAVSAGLIGAPMVIIVALTATTSLVVPSLYEPGVIMRFFFIILAGMAGLYGITIGLVLILFHLCSLKTHEVPYLAPLAPLDIYLLRDVVIRAPWPVLSQRKVKVQDMPGSETSSSPR